MINQTTPFLCSAQSSYKKRHLRNPLRLDWLLFLRRMWREGQCLYLTKMQWTNDSNDHGMCSPQLIHLQQRFLHTGLREHVEDGEQRL